MNLSEHKKQLYNTYARRYRRRTESYTEILQLDYEIFLEHLPKKTILDLGSGPGRDSRVFQARSYLPTCFDLSKRMLELCQASGLPTIQGDMETSTFGSEPYGGIWSYTSLTTIPKEKVWLIIDRLAEALVQDGLLFLGLIEGDGEMWKAADHKYRFARFVSRYSASEVQAKLMSKYELIYFRRIGPERTVRNTYLNFLFRKRSG